LVCPSCQTGDGGLLLLCREHQAKLTKQGLLERTGAKVQLAAQQAKVLVCEACLAVGGQVAAAEV
jgi:uncharacterized protein YbaR (Trm112 family)